MEDGAPEDPAGLEAASARRQHRIVGVDERDQVGESAESSIVGVFAENCLPACRSCLSVLFYASGYQKIYLAAEPLPHQIIVSRRYL